MFFNPLFISNNSASLNADSAKENKFTNSNYLFADIINITQEQIASEDLIELDGANKSVFDNLKTVTFPNATKGKIGKNRFIGDDKNITEFLNGLLSKSNNKNSGKKLEGNISVIPEQVTQIIESLKAGEKIAIPVENKGKNIFVEIEKFDADLVNQTSIKGIKLTDSANNLPEIDFEKLFSQISTALEKSFSSSEFKMNENKIGAILDKLKTQFSKLESVKTESFRPQKNILGNLINDVKTEFSLNDSESEELKNVIVTQFAGYIKENMIPQKSKSENSVMLVDGNSLVKELKLSPKEAKLIEIEKSSFVIPGELKNRIEKEIAAGNKSPELKKVLNKIENYILDKNRAVFAKGESGLVSETGISLKEVLPKMNLTAKEVVEIEKISKEKITLPELQKVVKAELQKPNPSPVLKSVSAKLDGYIAVEKSTKTTKPIEATSLKEVLPKMNLTAKEVVELEKISKEKITLPELQKVVKAELQKPNPSPMLKSISAKLDGYLSVTKRANAIETAPLKEILPKINLTTKEVAELEKVSKEKITLPELQKAVKTELQKPNSSPVLKSASAKLDGYSSVAKRANAIETAPLKEILPKINLTTKEVAALEKVSKEEITLPELQKAVKSDLQKPNANSILKSASLKLEKFVLENSTPVKSKNIENKPIKISENELKLNQAEVNTIKKLGVEKVDLDALGKSVITKLAKSPNNKELKALVGKVTTAKNLFANNKATDAPQSISENTKPADGSSKNEFLISVKNEKPQESLNVSETFKVATKEKELLRKSIYASKEGAELAKVKIIPINEAVRPKQVRHIKGTTTSRKEFTELKFDIANSVEKKGSAESKFSMAEQNNSQNGKGNYSDYSSTNVTDGDKFYAGINSKKDSETVNKFQKDTIQNNELKSVNGEAKTNEQLFVKPSFGAHNLQRNNFINTPKVVYKNVDIRNASEELSRLMQKGEKKLVEFQLNPENLGKMEIKIEVVNKIVSASIKVENEAVQQMMQNSLDGLKSNLTQNGVQYNSVNVSLANSDEKNQRFFKQKRKNNRAVDISGMEAAEETFTRKNLGYNNYDFIA